LEILKLEGFFTGPLRPIAPEVVKKP